MSRSPEGADPASDQLAQRRRQLVGTALVTLAERGYARTSLDDIAVASALDADELRALVADKLDLVEQCIREYKTECATHYDDVVATSTSAEELSRRFGETMADTLRDDAAMHRLWYDLRDQSLFEVRLRPVIRGIDVLLEDMIWTVVERFAELAGREVVVRPGLAYAVYDGAFEQALVEHLDGDPTALGLVAADCERLLEMVTGAPSR